MSMPRKPSALRAVFFCALRNSMQPVWPIGKLYRTEVPKCNRKANPFSDLFAMQALRLIFPNLEKACDDADALDAKEKMMQAAFYAGVAITCSGTTAVHALSYPLGGRYHIPHGVANAIMLMPVMQFNKSCCRKKFAEVYDAVGGTGAGTDTEKADWVINQMDAMVKHLDIPTSLKPYGVTETDLPLLVTEVV